MAEHIIVAKYQKGSDRFELVIDPDKAMAFRHGKASLSEAVRFPQVYLDAKKGEKAPASSLKKVFGTDDFDTIAEQIVRHGQIPQTAGSRDEQLQQLRARLIEMIHRFGVDPKTHAPHPRTRIDNAMNEAKVRIDANLSAEAQLQDVIKQLRPILPFKSETHTLKVQVPVAMIGSAMRILKGTGKMVREEWAQNGDLIATVEIPGGLSLDFQEGLMAATHGKAQFTVLKQE
jgi:ribosome maturation protein SDO1